MSFIVTSAPPPVALLEITHRAQEIDFAKGRPVHIREVELAVRALPEQESGQADFAKSPDRLHPHASAMNLRVLSEREKFRLNGPQNT